MYLVSTQVHLPMYCTKCIIEGAQRNGSSEVHTLHPSFLYENRLRRYCVLKGHINIIWLWLVEPWDTPLLDDSSRSPTPLWVTHHGPPPLLVKGDSSRPPPLPLVFVTDWSPPPLGSAGGPPPPEKDDSSSNNELATWRKVLYFDWVVQNINEHLWYL